MSLETFTWAFRQQIRPALSKFVLVALGDHASDETGLAYPSITSLCFKTSADRKTVIQALTNLEDAKLISDTGKRVGSTKQVKVYRLDGYMIDSGMIPEAEPLSNSAFIPEQQCRNSKETVPKAGHGTATEPQGNPKKKGGRLTDEEFIDALKQNPAYVGIDFEREFGLMDAWLLSPRGQRRKKTRNFILNWLSRAESVVAPNGKTNQRPVIESRRNVGTANEGRSAQYRGVGRLRRVSDAGRRGS